jgi:hypothetical protein
MMYVQNGWDVHFTLDFCYLILQFLDFLSCALCCLFMLYHRLVLETVESFLLMLGLGIELIRYLPHSYVILGVHVS